MKPLAPPNADNTIGLKIDDLAKRLAQALAPHGFRRQGRTLAAERALADPTPAIGATVAFRRS
jgi:hypothetical protein